MGKIFKPKKPKRDPDQDELIRLQKERMKEQESEIEARKAAKRRGSQGRESLISGAETGHPTRDTLG